MSDFTLADLIRESEDQPEDVYYSALMVCNDCEHRIIDHDQLTFRCRVCPCDQSQRGLSSHRDDALRDLSLAVTEVHGKRGERAAR